MPRHPQVSPAIAAMRGGVFSRLAHRIAALEGEAIYRYGQARFTLKPGDSISVDAELNHGFVEVLTPEFTFLTVQAERP